MNHKLYCIFTINLYLHIFQLLVNVPPNRFKLLRQACIPLRGSVTLTQQFVYLLNPLKVSPWLSSLLNYASFLGLSHFSILSTKSELRSSGFPCMLAHTKGKSYHTFPGRVRVSLLFEFSALGNIRQTHFGKIRESNKSVVWGRALLEH
jgi:hypothetical protein